MTKQDSCIDAEPERTDMVEYFGKVMQGFLFTEGGWVQSYGTSIPGLLLLLL